MTSRELADAIDELIDTKIAMQNTPDREVFRGLSEQKEVQLRELADAFKRLDHNPGVAVVGKDACGKDQ